MSEVAASLSYLVSTLTWRLAIWGTASRLHRFHFVWFRALRTIRILSPRWIFFRVSVDESRRFPISRQRYSETLCSMPCCCHSSESLVASKPSKPSPETATNRRNWTCVGNQWAQVARPLCQTMFTLSSCSPQAFPRPQAPPVEGAASFPHNVLWVLWS